eukprot:scaffold27037_cov30-Tisochrysis_lutea.AAC.3
MSANPRQTVGAHAPSAPVQHVRVGHGACGPTLWAERGEHGAGLKTSQARSRMKSAHGCHAAGAPPGMARPVRRRTHASPAPRRERWARAAPRAPSAAATVGAWAAAARNATAYVGIALPALVAAPAGVTRGRCCLTAASAHCPTARATRSHGRGHKCGH